MPRPPSDFSFSATLTTGSCWFSDANGGTCSQTDAVSCQKKNGIFTLGASCVEIIGACCLKDKENNTTIPCQNTTYSDCYDLAASFNYSFIWNKDRCEDVSCGNNTKEIGACCDGKGMCEETTLEQCNKLQHFFQGSGTICDKDICIGGTGACCDGVSCGDGISGSDCINSKRLYLGKSKKCFQFTTNTENLSCLDSIVGYKPKIGDIFEDGMVVGVYNPNNSDCFGNPIFGGGANFDELMYNGSVASTQYKSLYDYNGYGVLHDTLCENESDSYLLIISLHPSLDETSESQLYTWSHGGFYYGPLIKNIGKVVEPHADRLHDLKEGYVINTQLTTTTNRKIIEENSISNCSKRNYTDTAIERVYSRTTHNFNGRWSSDWGLHNTIRMVNAQLYYEEGMTVDSNLYPSLYSPSSEYDSSMVPSTKPIRDMNESSVPVIDTVSSWFIPSINELSFIAQQCKFSNLNENLQTVGGTPMFGEYWSSTGTFNFQGITGEEGYSNGITMGTIGTSAWSVNFDGNYSVKRDARLSQKKIRPIRLIRCDGKTLKQSEESVLWEVNY